MERPLLIARLDCAGVPILPTKDVLDCKIAVVRTLRDGPLGWAGEILNITLEVMLYISLLRPTDHLIQMGRLPRPYLAWGCLGLCLAGFFAGMALFAFGQENYLLPSFIFSLPAVCLVSGCESARLLKGTLLGRAASRWTRAHAFSTQGEFVIPPSAPWLPESLRLRAEKALAIEDTRVFIEYLNADIRALFIIVVHGYGPWADEAVIGAWGTGDPALDNA